VLARNVIPGLTAGDTEKGNKDIASPVLTHAAWNISPMMMMNVKLAQ
jgi:hypothetical protein